MIREKERCTNGKVVTILIPENEADLEEIRLGAEAGKIDDRESFGDDPEVWGFS